MVRVVEKKHRCEEARTHMVRKVKQSQQVSTCANFVEDEVTNSHDSSHVNESVAVVYNLPVRPDRDVWTRTKFDMMIRKPHRVGLSVQTPLF